jgi:outer membrane protein
MAVWLWMSAFVCAQDSAPMAQFQYSMQDCVRHALEHSPKVMAAEDSVRKAEAETGMARAGFFPQLSAFAGVKSIKGYETTGQSDADYDDQQTLSQGLQLTQTLFAGLTVINSYRRAVLAHEYARVEKEDVEARLSLEVQTKFLERQHAVEQLKMFEAHLLSQETNLRALEAMYLKNLVSYGAVLDTESEIAGIRQKISETKNFVTQKTIELKGLMQLPFDSEVVFLSPPGALITDLDMNMDQIRNHALTQRPVIRLIRLALEIVQKDRDMALGSFSPRVTLSLSRQMVDVNYKEPGTSLFGSVDRDYSKEYGVGMINLEWNLFQGGKGYYQLRQIKHELSRLNNGLREQETLTYSEVEKAYAAYEEAQSRLENGRIYLKSTQQNVAMSDARLQKTLGTLPELMLARAKLQDAESSLAKARLDSVLALANLYFAMGRPGILLAN